MKLAIISLSVTHKAIYMISLNQSLSLKWLKLNIIDILQNMKRIKSENKTHVCVCMHAYIYTHMYTDLYVCMHTYIHTCTHIYVPSCVCVVGGRSFVHSCPDPKS